MIPCLHVCRYLTFVVIERTSFHLKTEREISIGEYEILGRLLEYTEAQ